MMIIFGENQSSARNAAVDAEDELRVPVQLVCSNKRGHEVQLRLASQRTITKLGDGRS